MPPPSTATPPSLLERTVRGIVVSRGAEPMGPRELLPLTLPADVPQDATDAVDDDVQASDDSTAEGDRPPGWADMQPFQRGPEITERR
ncbi:hypothetical protein GCM10025868_05400 [Angustibacter aerolatus]|uniref:Uncharacterized protein n=1 Tax=Angustibacter aerolatus TaxID=1162965 RepID=A0ABQ6JAU2_9ACTN|nr:hypothetical protein GCM10025868_05400 [Angustibacter aerolatus]